jgi:hypothetical protein
MPPFTPAELIRLRELQRTLGLEGAKRVVIKESMKRRALEATTVTELATIINEIVDAL